VAAAEGKEEDRTPSPAARTFWIRNLILKINSETPGLVESEKVREHMLHVRKD
jgi:hypothetical protein